MGEDYLEYTSLSLEKAEAKINNLGLPIPEKPNGDAKWPSNVADLSMDELSEHMSWWKGWAAYSSWHLARAEVNYSSLEEEYDTEYNSRIFKSTGDYNKVTELKAAIKQAPDMIKKKLRVVEIHALVVLLRSLYKGYDDKYAVVSREVSRRGITESPIRAESKSYGYRK